MASFCESSRETITDRSMHDYPWSLLLVTQDRLYLLTPYKLREKPGRRNDAETILQVKQRHQFPRRLSGYRLEGAGMEQRSGTLLSGRSLPFEAFSTIVVPNTIKSTHRRHPMELPGTLIPRCLCFCYLVGSRRGASTEAVHLLLEDIVFEQQDASLYG